MKASLIYNAILHAYRKRRPLMLWGPPGIGKTDVVAQAAETLKIGLVDFRLALRDPTDLKGYPIPDLKSRKMVFLHDEQLPTDGEGILFMDEMNSAPPSVGAAAMQLTLTGRIGTYVLPEGWAIIAAGNREEDMGVTFRMPAPLLNRFSHLTMEPSNEEWENWALTNGKVAVSPELIAFHRFRRDKLFTFDPKKRQIAFATPRSWVATDEIKDDPELHPEAKYAMIRGTVGDGEGGEYWTFLQTQAQLPSIDDIRKKPKSVVVPDDPSIMWCLCTMVASYAATPKDFGPLAEFVQDKLPMEYQAVFIRDVLKRAPDMKTNKDYQKWAFKNHQLMM